MANYKLIIDSNFGCCTIQDIKNSSTIAKVERKISTESEYQTLWDTSSIIVEQGINILPLSEFKDYSCDIFTQYTYRINGKDTEILTTQEIIFEDIILFDNDSAGGAQLIRFNPSLSSLKRTQAESITQTLGGKYPVIRRNGDMDYYTFTLGGLISTLALKNQYTNEAQRTLEERKFRKEFVDGLCNGHVKLFKAGPEGMMLVRITNVTLTPESKLGRDIYSFSATVTEVANATVDNLRRFNIYSPVDSYFTVNINEQGTDDEIYFVVRG